MTCNLEDERKSVTLPMAKGLMDVIARSVSCRAHKPAPPPLEHLMQILEAARLAPSACNKQPWRFAVVRDTNLRRRIPTSPPSLFKQVRVRLGSWPLTPKAR